MRIAQCKLVLRQLFAISQTTHQLFVAVLAVQLKCLGRLPAEEDVVQLLDTAVSQHHRQLNDCPFAIPVLIARPWHVHREHFEIWQVLRKSGGERRDQCEAIPRTIERSPLITRSCPSCRAVVAH